MNIKHSSKSAEWFTPAPILNVVKRVLGSIDLDPASNELANKEVQASVIFTKETDGLLSDWPVGCSVFVNPPGSKINGKSNTVMFWQKLMAYQKAGKLRHAIFLAFSMEAMQTTQDKDCKAIMDFPLCVPSKRIAFVSPNGDKDSPSHANCIVYVPGTVNKTELFINYFSQLGACKK